MQFQFKNHTKTRKILKIVKIFENPEEIIRFSYHMKQNIKQPALTNSAYVCSCESPSQSNRGGNIYKGKTTTTTTINPVKIPTDDSKLEKFSNFSLSTAFWLISHATKNFQMDPKILALERDKTIRGQGTVCLLLILHQ